MATVASFTNEVNLRLAKRPLVFNGLLANRGLTSCTSREMWTWVVLCRVCYGFVPVDITSWFLIPSEALEQFSDCPSTSQTILEHADKHISPAHKGLIISPQRKQCAGKVYILWHILHLYTHILHNYKFSLEPTIALSISLGSQNYIHNRKWCIAHI